MISYSAPIPAKKNIAIANSSVVPVYSEIQMVNGIKARDEEALLEFYNRYASSIFSMLCKIFPDRNFAEQVLEKTFIQACSHINNYNGKMTMFLWVFNMARNNAIDLLCSNSFQKSSVQPNDNRNIKSNASNILASKSAQNLLLQLECIERTVIVLAYYRGFSSQQISEFLQVPLVVVKKKLQVAYLKLRTAFKQD